MHAPMEARTVKAVAVIAATVAFAAVAGGCLGTEQAPRSYAGDPLTRGGLKQPARVEGEALELAIGGRFESRFWPGVNLGPTVPGTFPGEMAAKRPDYDRWLSGMGDLGARVVRVYTILGPPFYEALAAYNRAHGKAPIYVIHGVWIPEEEFLATGDAYAPAVVREFRRELNDAVSVVHGDADLPARRGHAAGRYRADISRWVLAWSPGVEWNPDTTAATDRKHRGRRPYRGRFFEASSGATPMESWITSMLDHLAGLEARRGWSRPLTFTNWVTTDPLRHPDEPLPSEDAVSIDAKHVRSTRAWPGGFFASYHVYPYYPDALSLQPSYRRFRRKRDGKADPYSGYLSELRTHHRGQAVMITEFGVPTSIGVAHRGSLGRDQGGHSEKRAGEIDAELTDDIREEGYAGALLFAYLDEWFKITWNTVDYERPAERRHLWRNPLTNEEHFGIVAAEAGTKPAVVVDGKDGEWKPGQSRVVHESRGAVRAVRATNDEEYLYLGLRFDDQEPWNRRPLTLGLDVRPGGNRGLPGLPGTDPRADVAVTIGPGDRARLRQSAWWDPIAFQYGLNHGYVKVRQSDLRAGSGAWVAPRLILNRRYTVPTTRVRRAAELMDLGTLRWGTTNSDEGGYDNRNLVSGSDRVLELRLPWGMLGFADPSRASVYVPRRDGSIGTRRVGKLGITVVGAGPPVRTADVAWDSWDTVASWHERRKQGFGAVAEAFARAAE